MFLLVVILLMCVTLIGFAVIALSKTVAKLRNKVELLEDIRRDPRGEQGRTWHAAYKTAGSKGVTYVYLYAQTEADATRQLLNAPYHATQVLELYEIQANGPRIGQRVRPESETTGRNPA